MSCLYITEQGSKITVSEGKVIVECKDGLKRMVPQEILESIMIFGNVSMTIPAQKLCLENGIKVTYLSTKGKYFGRLESTAHFNAKRLKDQVYLSDNDGDCLEFAIKVQKAKVHNQRIILKRYEKNSDKDIREELQRMEIYENKLSKCECIDEVMGYEGMAAKEYFRALSKIVREEFAFNGRSRQPPLDAFNSMLSFAYTIIFYEIYAELQNRDLSPYIGFIHKIKQNHPALVSDMIEEWRAVLADATILSLVQGREISKEEFTTDEETGAVQLSDNAIKICVKKLEEKMRKNINYLEYLDSPTSFRRAIWWQVKTLAACVDEEDFTNYKPLRIK